MHYIIIICNRKVGTLHNTKTTFKNIIIRKHYTLLLPQVWFIIDMFTPIIASYTPSLSTLLISYVCLSKSSKETMPNQRIIIVWKFLNMYYFHRWKFIITRVLSIHSIVNVLLLYSDIHCIMNLIWACILRGSHSKNSLSWPWSPKNNYDFIAVFIVLLYPVIVIKFSF